MAPSPAQIYAYVLRHDLCAFIHRSFLELNPQNKYEHNWHIELLASKLEDVRAGQCKRLIVNVPPRHLKSLAISIAFPAWVLGHEPGKQILPEQVLALNPDVIIAAWCGAGDRVPLPKLVRERHWLDLKASREARVYCIRDEFLNTPAPTLIHGLRALAAALHPEVFPGTAGLLSITEVQARNSATLTR